MRKADPRRLDFGTRKQEVKELTVVEWLLDSDPSIRWQVMRDLTDGPDEVVAVERSRVASEGWGARLLGLQAADGGWGAVENPSTWEETPECTATNALTLLREMGLDPSSEAARKAVTRVRENVTYIFQGGKPYFGGETEACINGRVLAIGAYYSEPDQALLNRLLSEQLDDGGWNCDAPPSIRSSFHSTICVLEGLLEYERAQGPTAEASEAQARGQEYLLERRMFRSLSSGRVINDDWARFSYPSGWHYDVLRGLDYLSAAGVEPDDRIAEAVELVENNRLEDGRWPLQNPHDDSRILDFDMGETADQPSRWITLRALRVMKWVGHGG